MSGQNIGTGSALSRARQTAQKGFTLVEMAIVLVIIGLIVGGVLKGQEIVNSGRIKIQVSQVDGMKAVTQSFTDRYGFAPGDFKGGTAFGISTTFDGDQDGFVGAKGTSSATAEAIGDEMAMALVQLSASGFLSGVQPGTIVTGQQGNGNTALTDIFYPAKINGAFIFWGDIAFGTITNKMVVITKTKVEGTTITGGVRTADAAGLDNKYDDGLPGTGSILASSKSDTAQCCNGSACSNSTALKYGLSANGSATGTYCAMLWQTE